jgi:ligand-binding sensor domain-containing protein/signal transduction histidine kinase
MGGCKPLTHWLAVAIWVHAGVVPLAISAELPLQGHVDSDFVQLPVIDANDIRFTRLSTAQGLSQTRVTQIVEDEQGFMWFGTQYGLNRYDGYNFRTFVNDPKDPNSLSGALVSALFKDRNGALWIGCNESLNKFDLVRETFQHYPIPLVNHISEDSAGWLWLSTGQGLFRLEPRSGHIDRYVHDAQALRSLSSIDIKASMEDREGNFWVITSEGLDEFDRKTSTVILHVPLRLTGREASLHEDRLGVLWISYVTGNGLAVFDRKTRILTRYSFNPREQPSTALTGVSAILEDKAGTLWFATMNKGLLKLDHERRRFVRYSNNPSDPDSLARDGILSLREDRTGDMWAALVDSGLSHFEPRPPPFQRFPHNLGNPSGNSEPFVSAIYEDQRGILWIGTREALNRLDRKTGEHKMYRFAGSGLASPDVISIIEDRSGVLWVGTFNGGLLRFDRATGRFKAYRYDPHDANSLSNDIVTRMSVDRDGFLWVATWDGLNRFDASTERFTRYYSNRARKDILYLELAQSPDGELWLGTHSSGLERFDGQGKFTTYQRRPENPDTLSDNRVNSVHFDRSGTIWLGTQNGLDSFDRKTSKFTAYTAQDGLAGNVVGCVLEDDRGDLWMSTNDGVSRFNVASKTFRNYSTDDGLPGRDLTGWGACFKSRRGELFFGGFSGGIAFYPDKVNRPSDSPSIVLTEFRLFGKPVTAGPHSILSKSISYTTALTLSHEQNAFSLEFSSPNHSAVTRYRYELEGIDRHWNEAGSDQRSVAYGALPAGDYIFRAQATRSQGDWSDASVALKIRILPPWWETLWFRAFYGSLIALLFWLAYQYKRRQIVKDFNLRLEERVNERTRIARDLHDTLLQSFLGVLMKFDAGTSLIPDQPAEAQKLLETACMQARQAVTEGRNAVQGLRASTVVTNDLARAIGEMGEELRAEQTDGHSPEFHVYVAGTSRDLPPLVRDEVYRIAGEALRNAFRHAQARRIDAEIRYERGQLRILVRDDGKGIDPPVLSAGQRAGHHGLPGMNERAKLVEGKLSVRSRLNAGTEIELTIPGSLAYAKSAVARRGVASGQGDG